jgi:hypothetical protein
MNFNEIDICHEGYSEAVLHLAKLAQGDTGGSLVAAQVLLSAYNGKEWQLNITDLSNLDYEHYNSALIVIQGRVKLMMEPQECLENGQDIFEKLWDQWNRYHINNRWKSTCGDCYGLGKVYIDDSGESEEMEKCNRCNGTGLLT